MSSTAQLLQRVASLAAPERDQEVVRYARSSQDNLASVLAELDAGGMYERRLGALMAVATRDAAWITAHVADEDAALSRWAMKAAMVACPQALDASLEDAPAVRRAALINAVLQSHHGAKRTALADRLFPLFAEWSTEGVGLLAACSPGVVASALPSLLHAVTRWRSLARAHPAIVLETLRADLAAAPAVDKWWNKYATALQSILRVSPASATAILGALDDRPPTTFPSGLRSSLNIFARTAPGRVLTLLTSELGTGVGYLAPNLIRTLARSGAPELVDYARSVSGNSYDLARLLSAQPPRDRAATYNAAVAGRGGAQVDGVILDALPRALAAEFARRDRKAGEEKGDSWQVLLFKDVYLPPAEVREPFLEGTRRPGADERSTAWALFVRNAVYSGDPTAVTAVVVAAAERLRNEQSPVRLSAISSFSSVPARLWTIEALPHLTTVFQDALDAPDTNDNAWSELIMVAIRMLRERGSSPEHVKWAMDCLTRANVAARMFHIGRRDTLPRRQAMALCKTLRPIIDADLNRNDCNLVIALAQVLGKHVNDVPELEADLLRAIQNGKRYYAIQAVDCWLLPKPTRHDRVRQLMDFSPSAADLAPVAKALSWSCTELLGAALGSPPYGRFLNKQTAWSFPADSRATRRWTPEQTTAYLAQLSYLVSKKDLPTWHRCNAARTAGSVTGGLDLARELAKSDNLPISEAALMSLSSSPDDLPLLFSFADNDKARVAMYAATRASRFVKPSRLEPLLEGILTSKAKVTSRKEAVRLAAQRLPAPHAASLLQRIVPEAHKDVRAAAISFAAFQLLGTDGGWAIVSSAANDKDEAPRLAAIRVKPLDVAPEYRERYAQLVGVLSQTDDDNVASMALVTLEWWAPYSASAPVILGNAAADMARPSRSVWQSAAMALVKISDTPSGQKSLCDAMASLVAHGPEPDAEDKWDRPADRRIAFMADHIDTLAERDRKYGATALTLSRLLAQHDFISDAANLRLSATDLDKDAATVVEELREVAFLCTDRPVLAAELGHELKDRLQCRRGNDEQFLAVVRDLAAPSTAAEGLLAVAIVDACGGRGDWPHDWRNMVKLLRNHAVPDVRGRAKQIKTADA
ncbi:uncharacterized protein EHS24_003409 [Apiotrichum porosum]|uniref:Uncharacterized protein n=1 Tax=Apiotrichum porosum TaxID=105984 RepID=A0A427XF12_9TREE|nr:uncharacterized protein EHS24_003409 [Apiotrichum porosum]RSH77438.1 hypothetical protein EHS24_003409 [Apiotrichum porosum]